MESYGSSAEPHNSPPIGFRPSAINRIAESLTKPIPRKGSRKAKDADAVANALKGRPRTSDWSWKPEKADMAAIRRGNRKIRAYAKRVGDSYARYDYKPKPQVSGEGAPVNQRLSSNLHEKEHELEFRQSQSRMSGERPLRFGIGHKKLRSRFGIGEQREDQG